jgi:IS605 OrfB family transposase
LNQQRRVIRTERIWAKQNPTISKFCHLSKNLFNKANYIVRQAFFSNETWIKAVELKQLLEDSETYMCLPPRTAFKILQLVERMWKSFFNSSADWKTNPKKYFQKPRPPKYKRKEGEFILPFKKSQLQFSNGTLILSFVNINVKTRLKCFQSVLGGRIIPQGYGYVLEILYVKNIPTINDQDPKRIVGVDIGLTNLVAIVNNIGIKPIVIKGGVAKSINQYYNKEYARLKSVYTRQGKTTGIKLRKLMVKRKRKLRTYFHEVSRFITSWCQQNNIDTVIIGYNKYWKQHIKLGKRMNQNFVTIPFDWLIHQLQYKLNDEGIRIITINEWYTSKCSFLDRERISRKTLYQGERISRGLYRSSTGIIINSDVNGGYNIIKKEVPNAFSQQETVDGIEGVWLHPIKLKAIRQPVVC